MIGERRRTAVWALRWSWRLARTRTDSPGNPVRVPIAALRAIIYLPVAWLHIYKA